MNQITAEVWLNGCKEREGDLSGRATRRQNSRYTGQTPVPDISQVIKNHDKDALRSATAVYLQKPDEW